VVCVESSRHAENTRTKNARLEFGAQKCTKMQEWKMWTGKCRTRNARLENAGVEIAKKERMSWT